MVVSPDALKSSYFHQLLGCEWGRRIALPDDRAECPERAVQRMMLHGDAAPGGMWLVQLCRAHFDKVSALTDPHAADNAAPSQEE